MAATRFILRRKGVEGETRCTLQGLSRGVRVSFLRALGYAWLGEAITARQRLGGLGENGDARAFAAAGDALLRLSDPVSFLVSEFAEVTDAKYRDLQKLVASELYRGMRDVDCSGLHDLLREAVAKRFATRAIDGSVLSYWMPIFLDSSGHWPVDIEPLASKGFPAAHSFRTIWAKRTQRVSLRDLYSAWLARRGGQSARELSERYKLPMSVVARMLRRLGHSKCGAEHKYPGQAVDAVFGRYKTVGNREDYIDIATVLRNGMTLDECVRRILDPANIQRRAIALVQHGDKRDLMFAKWVLPYCWSVRVVVPYGYGENLSDLRWTSVKIAARFLRIERATVYRWVEEGHLGIVLPGVPSEAMGIPREALRRLRHSQLGWYLPEGQRSPRRLTVSSQNRAAASRTDS
ncbi:hypothetical protein SGO26_26560 [Cupriavidus metallidurans]|uniref:hypothetical protein n=1 Tax=Cupriavidus TaxID=106589 RepID=UPI00056C0308|nr:MULTISPECIES: hypothetical protein [Cupriavidus]GMG95103.1 hypothetical protein Cmtc_63230 [Cupriavidus sp. TKC]